MGKIIMNVFKFAGILSFVVFTAGCSSGGIGPISAPEECSFVTGGSADEAFFSEHFSRIVIVSKGEEIPESGGEHDLVFNTEDELELVVVSKDDTQLQVCISERKGGGRVVLSESFSLVEGENRLDLGSLARNPYVVRIGVNDTLVRNLTFSIQ